MHECFSTHKLDKLVSPEKSPGSIDVSWFSLRFLHQTRRSNVAKWRIYTILPDRPVMLASPAKSPFTMVVMVFTLRYLSEFDEV